MEKSNDLILRTVSKIIIFVILIFSFYLFFTGHSTPGGGFIGGLMAAAALLLLAIAFDVETLRKVIPFDFRMVTAIGLLLALLTGMGSFVFAAPFLSHSFAHFHLPLLGETELNTAVLFDLGVYLAVVGVTMTILLSIGEDR